MISEAIILAGGKGTRLQSVIPDLPKPMAPVRGKPFLEYLLKFLSAQGIKSAILSVGYEHEKIVAHFGKTFSGLNLRYAIEDRPLGTGGGIRLASSMMTGESAIVFNGDSLFCINLNSFSAFHAANNAILSLALLPMKNFDRYGTVKVNEGNLILAFREKRPTESGLINAGVYAINRKIWEQFDFPASFSFEKDLMETHCQGVPFYGYVEDAYFIDIGIPEDYQRAQNEFERFEN